MSEPQQLEPDPAPGSRRTTAVLAAVAAVAAAIAVGVVVPPLLSGTDDGGPGEGGPAASDRYTPLMDDRMWEEPRAGECATQNKVFDPSAAPPIENLDEQFAQVDQALALHESAFSVLFARATPLGAVALISCDEAAAEQRLGELGISLVYLWDPTDSSEGEDDPEEFVRLVVADAVRPVATRVQRETRGIPGDSGVALWINAGAVLLQWKEPVPEEVATLADRQWPNGVRVYVEEVTYSSQEIQAAGNAVADNAREANVPFTSAGGCGDGSGLVVGLEPDKLAGHEEEYRSLLEGWAGMPVTVVPEEMASLM